MPDPNKRIQNAVQFMCGSWDKARADWDRVPATCKDRVVNPAEAAIAHIRAKIKHQEATVRARLQRRAVTRFMDMFKLSYAPAFAECTRLETNGNTRAVSPAGVTRMKTCMTDALTGNTKLSFVMYTKDGKRRIKLNMKRDAYVKHIRDLAVEEVGAAGTVVSLPGPLAKEIKYITDMFPLGDWRSSHLVERVVRLYLETKTELRQGKAAKAKYNDNKVALEVVQAVRRIALLAAGLPVPAAGVKVKDADAKKTYQQLTKTGATFKAQLREFLWAMTNYFVRMAKINTTGTGTSAKHEVNITLRRASEIRTAINNGSTLALTKTRKTGKPKTRTEWIKPENLEAIIMQSDMIRGQMVKALKRFYPIEAKIGFPQTKAEYVTKRDALRPVVGKMVDATIRGMKRTFTKHFAKSKAPITLGELEAIGVKLVGTTKNPDYVIFRLSALKSTAGVPKTEVIDPIMNGYPGGNKRVRAASAMRRYQQALQKMSDADQNDPAKIKKLQKTLVAKLKHLSDKLLLLSQIAGVAKDGTVKISFPPKALYPYASDPKVWSLGNQAAAMKLKPEYVDLPELGVVDIVDRIKQLYAELMASNKNNKDLASKEAKDAVAKELVRQLVFMSKDKPVGEEKGKDTKGVGIIWDKTGKGVPITMTKTTKTEPIMDGGVVTGTRTVTIYTPEFELKDKEKDGSSKFSFPNVVTGSLGKGWTGTLTTHIYGGVNYMKDLGITHYQVIQVGGIFKHKGGFFMGLNVGAENIEGQAADRFSRLTEGGPIRNIPFKMDGPFAVSRYIANAFLGYTSKAGNWKLKGQLTGGLLSTRPGVSGAVSREYLSHNEVNPTLSGSRMEGLGAMFSAVFDDGDKKRKSVHKGSLTLGVKGGAPTSAALRSNDNEDKAHWRSGTHLAALLAVSYSYKNWIAAKLGVGIDKQWEGKMMHPTLPGVPRTPAGTQFTVGFDLTSTPLDRKKMGSTNLSIILNAGVVAVTQKYDRIQVPNKANETLGYLSASLRLGTAAGDFSLYGAANFIEGSYTNYLVLDPRTNDVTEQIVDYDGLFLGGGLCWSKWGMRTCAGINRFRIQSKAADEKKWRTGYLLSIAAPF